MRGSGELAEDMRRDGTAKQRRHCANYLANHNSLPHTRHSTHNHAHMHMCTHMNKCARTSMCTAHCARTNGRTHTHMQAHIACIRARRDEDGPLTGMMRTRIPGSAAYSDGSSATCCQ